MPIPQVGRNVLLRPWEFWQSASLRSQRTRQRIKSLCLKAVSPHSCITRPLFWSSSAVLSNRKAKEIQRKLEMCCLFSFIFEVLNCKHSKCKHFTHFIVSSQ